MERFLYPKHPVRFIITGPSKCGKSCFARNLILEIINKFEKSYIYSLSLRQDLLQKLMKCLSNYIPIHIIPNNLNEKDIDSVNNETVNDKAFEESARELETYDSTEELKFLQDYEDGGIFILGALNEPEKNGPGVQAIFKGSRHNNLSIFIFSPDYYEIPKRTIRNKGLINHVFKPNNYRDIHNFYQDKTSMDMTLKELKYLSSTCWDKKYQPITFDMTKDKLKGRYRVGFNSLFVPKSTHLKTL